MYHRGRQRQRALDDEIDAVRVQMKKRAAVASAVMMQLAGISASECKPRRVIAVFGQVERQYSQWLRQQRG